MGKFSKEKKKRRTEEQKKKLKALAKHESILMKRIVGFELIQNRSLIDPLHPRQACNTGIS